MPGNVPAAEIALLTVNIIGSSPLLGFGIDPDKLPAETNVLNSGDLGWRGDRSELHFNQCRQDGSDWQAGCFGPC